MERKRRSPVHFWTKLAVPPGEISLNACAISRFITRARDASLERPGSRLLRPAGAEYSSSGTSL